ncbi:hypothetical protein JW933_09835 [candidate division FCPU426 bacterium]|nr:hypothetical protein [candidate division FCPU426 bacterium]
MPRNTKDQAIGGGMPVAHSGYGSIGLVLTPVVLEILYLLGFYYCLTADNPFNYNNNYHLAAFITCLLMLVNLSLFVLYVDMEEIRRCRHSTAMTCIPAAAMVYFSTVLLLAVFIVLPLVLYFMLVDDFVIRLRQWIPVALGAGLLTYAYWRRWPELLAGKGMVQRLLYLLLMAVLVLLLMDILTGIIPTSVRSGGESVIFPL